MASPGKRLEDLWNTSVHREDDGKTLWDGTLNPPQMHLISHGYENLGSNLRLERDPWTLGGVKELGALHPQGYHRFPYDIWIFSMSFKGCF